MQTPNPALSTPTLGSSSFPIELLRFALIHVHPKDLVILATANRHLRGAVAGCIDSNLAQHHISRYGSHWDLRKIPFNHPLLRFHHTVAALAFHGLDEDDTERIWGRPRRWSSRTRENELFPERAEALGVALQKRFGTAGWLEETWREKEVRDLANAIHVAGDMGSVKLLQHIFNVIPETMLRVPESVLMRRVFTLSAQMGFTQGLALVPGIHSLLRDNSSLSLLRVAISFNQIPATKLLLEKGAVVSRTVYPGSFPSNVATLQLLLQHGFDPNWPFQERTSFSKLTEDASYDILKVLLEHGADANARDASGSSLLHHCALNTQSSGTSQCKSIPLLLDAGADIDALDRQGYTPLSLACTVKNVSLNSHCIRLLLESGANLNANCRWPPLHAAADRGLVKIVKLLLAEGAQVNFPNSTGKTALHVALEDGQKYKQVRVPMLLLETGADPTLRCHADRTPLHALPEVVTWGPDTQRLFDALVERGAVLEDNAVWQKLCDSARRDQDLLRWVLERGGFEDLEDKVDAFLVTVEWLFEEEERGAHAPLTEVLTVGRSSRRR
ncbi:hypothetical protein HDU96_010833 [Phlyctochytrium bullatum]|nr:hypothetical protein HDU96_010833 [Phlyctochytrium bullatum]